MIALGAVAAFNKGLSGGGYGPLVTAGQVVSGVSPKSAVAITSLAESLTCLIGLVAYWVMHGQIDWMLAGPLTLGAMLSVPVATLTVRGLSEGMMRASVGAVNLPAGHHHLSPSCSCSGVRLPGPLKRPLLVVRIAAARSAPGATQARVRRRPAQEGVAAHLFRSIAVCAGDQVLSSPPALLHSD